MRVGIAFVIAASLGVLTAEVRDAEACSLLTPPEFALDAAYADDITPPAAVLHDHQVLRTEADGSCEELGYVSIELEVSDDRAPARRLGYELRLLAGYANLSPETRGTWSAGEVGFYFDPDDDVDATVEITVIDLNGNRSAPVVVHVYDEAPLFGCSASGARGRGSVALVVLAALVVLRCRGGRGNRGAPSRRA